MFRCGEISFYHLLIMKNNLQKNEAKELTVKESNSKKDHLYNGLPCVWDGEEYIVFSPYAQKIASISHQQLDNPSFSKELRNMVFFGESLNEKSEEIAEVSLIVTTDCNLNCKYCYAEKGNRPLYLQPGFAIRALKEVIKPFTKKIYITFFGGEPTLNIPVLRASIDYVESLGIGSKYHIVTNGVISDEILNFLIDNRFNLTVSMDGLPEINDVQRPMKNGKGSSIFVERTIKRLVKENAHFQVRTTITQFNVNNMIEAFQYWTSLGVKFVHFEPVNIGKRKVFSGFIAPDMEIYLKNVKRALDKADELGIYVINSAYMNLLTPSKYFCTIIGGERFLFTPDGGVSVCYRVQSLNDTLKDFIIGKYNSKTDEFEIDTSKLKEFRNIKVDVFEKCKSCFARYVCGSGCPYRNFTQTGSFQKVDRWMCDAKKELIHDAIIRIYKSSKNGKESVVLGTSIFENLQNLIT